MILPRDKPRPKCGDCFFYNGNRGVTTDRTNLHRCVEDSERNYYSGTRRSRFACCCDFFLPQDLKETSCVVET